MRDESIRNDIPLDELTIVVGNSLENIDRLYGRALLYNNWKISLQHGELQFISSTQPASGGASKELTQPHILPSDAHRIRIMEQLLLDSIKAQ
jgi:hypothetical protein